MLAQTILALGAIALSSVSAQYQSVCQASPYRALSCLASNTAAADECSSRLPAITSTVTSTTTVLSQITASSTVSSFVKSQVTASLTNAETTTETITLSGASTSYSPVIVTTCLSSTITTYTNPSPTATGQREKRQATSAACVSSGLESLSSFNNETLSNACSCLAIPAPTTVSTIYVTDFVRATTTSIAGLAPTTTAEFLDKITVTVTVTPSAVVIPVSTTTTITETSTVSLAAPTYSQIFGPQAGCSNMGSGPAQPLDATITDDCEADKVCQDLCSQEPACKFLYVQRLFVDYGGSAPYFQCFMNDKAFDEERDLQCGRQEGIWGVARGFDACGRGTAAAA